MYKIFFFLKSLINIFLKKIIDGIFVLFNNLSCDNYYNLIYLTGLLIGKQRVNEKYFIIVLQLILI